MLMTTVNHPLINKLMNDVHCWGEADQSPLTRMFLTRIGGIACAGVEAGALASAIARYRTVAVQATWTYAARAAHRLFPNVERLARYAEGRLEEGELGKSSRDVCSLIAGIASTLFIGILFSPEINFRFHLSLGLAANDLSARKEKELASRLQAEMVRAEVERAREERFNRLIEQRNAKKKEEEQRNRFDPRLADLL